jgi:hypothetical protein
MGDGFFERNLKRLLGTARRPVEPDALFREQLRRRLQWEGSRIREGAQAAAGGAAAAEPEAQPRRRAPWRVAAAAVVLIVAAGTATWLVRNTTGATSKVDCRLLPVAQLEPLRLPADDSVVMAVPRGAQGAVSLERAGAELARLELKDGAEVSLQPDRVPVLSLSEGVLRVQAHKDVRVRAASVEVAVGPDADVEVERIEQRGAKAMNKSWLIPGGLVVAAGATVVAVLVHQGNAEVKTPDSRPAVVGPEKPLMIETPATRPVGADDRDQKLAQAQWKIAELEKKLAAAKKESDKLAAELVQKKGVTIENLTKRIDELKKGSMLNVMLPGKTADIIADLKGLGPAGTQAILDMLKSEDAKDRFIAAKLLEDLKDPAAIPALRDVALNDADAAAANMAGHALALMGDPQTVDTLREIATKKRSWEAEVNSLWGLVNLGDAQGREWATAYMQNMENSKQARAALGANIAVFMHTPEVMPIVDRTVQDFSKSAEVMGFAIAYYAAVNNPEARSRLQAIVDNAQLPQAIRDQAREALAR